MSSHKKSAIAALAEFDADYVSGRSFVLGIDEAGRGSLAGPVSAGAVLIRQNLYVNPDFLAALADLNDSKQLNESSREDIFKKLEAFKLAGAIDFEAGFASVDEIEKHNILGATQIAMTRAAEALNTRNTLLLRRAGAASTLFGEGAADLSKAVVLIDGRTMKKFPYAHQAIVKGDASSLAVAAASIVAKVSRDRLMGQLALNYPRYGFETHKGYGTPAHLQALLLYGACRIHRPSFLKKLRAGAVEEKQGELF